MKKTIFASAAIVALTLCASAYSDNTIAPAQQKQIEDIVHNYLVKNPEVLVEALQNLQQKQMEQAKKTIQKTQETAPKFANPIFHQADDPSIGNPNAKITVVEFFDYQCPHCMKMAPVLDKLIKDHPDVRVVFKEFPIRGSVSDSAAKMAIAANKQGKYFDFHKALMKYGESDHPLTDDSIQTVAKSVGLDVTKLKTDTASDSVVQKIKSNYKLGQDLQLIGTPAFFVAKSNVGPGATSKDIVFIPGQVTEEQLDATIKKFE